MHTIKGTFIKDMPPEYSNSENCEIYSIKILLPPNKSRILYYKSKDSKDQWLKKLRNIIGDADMFEFYNFEDNLGKG